MKDMDDRVEIEMEITTMFSVNARKTKTIFVEKAEWYAMTADEREKFMHDEMQDFLAEQILVDWSVV
jgi:hypothetical protein